MNPRPRSVFAASSLAVVLGWSAEGRADLRTEARALADAWGKNRGGAVTLGPSFLARGARRTVGVPLEPSAEWPCITVAGLAVRGASFTLELRRSGSEAAAGDEAEGADTVEDAASRSSAASIAVVQRCLDDSERAARLTGGGGGTRDEAVIGFGSARGVVELVAVRHRGALPPVEVVLPARATAEVDPSDERGPRSLAPLQPEPLGVRLERAIRRARRDGAVETVTAVSPSSDEGSGGLVLRLAAGCHRLGLFAEARDGRAAALDLDAEVRREGAAAPFRMDRSHAPDARLEFCLGEAPRIELRWFGAGGARPVTLLDAHFPSPALPEAWSSEERAVFAWALFKRSAPRPTAPPRREWLGSAGTTTVPFEVEPGSCHLVVAGAVAADAVGMRLSIAADGEAFHDDAIEDPRGAAVTFCAGASGHARATVELRARSGAFRLASWQLAGASR